MTIKQRIREIIRQFKENGLKLLLENGLNVRDVLALLQSQSIPFLEWIDFKRMVRVPVTFVLRDYRHVEADIVLRAPFHRPGSRRSRPAIMIYILIEHQSEPDALMPLRLLEYVIQIYKAQVRDWLRHHKSTAGIRLQPVLPLVFYTGSQRWESVGRLADLVAFGEMFGGRTPALDPLFLNLAVAPPDDLESTGGFFGWVLRLVQERDAKPEEFKRQIERVVEHLETMPAKEQMRWLELLSYIRALVYNQRPSAEQTELHEAIEASVHTTQHRKEIKTMFESGADVLREEGRKQGRKQGRKEGQREGELRSQRKSLLRLLHSRFDDIPAEVLAAIEATDSIQLLETWFDRCLTAGSLDEIGIVSTK